MDPLASDPLGGPALAGVLWAALRVWAILRVQVVFRRAIASPLAWECVAFTLAGALALALSPQLEIAVTGEGWVVRAFFEFALGTVIGLCVSLLGHAIVGAAELSSALVCANHDDSFSGGALGQGFSTLMVTLTAALGLELGLHRPLLAALRDTFFVWPLGQPERWSPDGGAALWSVVVSSAHDLLVLALAFASPVLLCFVVTDLVLRLLAAGPRSVSGLLECARPWLCTALALIALSAAWAAYPRSWGRVFVLPS
jgi:flagellar biosynthesis protein FliR